MIQVEGLCKRYPGAPEEALRGVSFEVPSGAVAAVVGQSGSGKTTLLRCLVGLERFEGGTVRVDGVESHGQAGAALRQRVGLVFQSFELFPHLTVFQNCALAPTCVQKQPHAQVATRVLELLTELSLADKRHAFPGELSGGQRQRVALARALAMQPSVLLYDEPTSALDVGLKREVQQTLARVQKTGVTQLLVTHDLALARAAASHLFVMHQGQLVEQGLAQEVLRAPRHPVTQRLLSDAHPHESPSSTLTGLERAS